MNFARAILFSLVLFCLALAGCGGSSSFVAQGGASQPEPTGTIRIEQVLLRALPSGVTQQRFTGFDSTGAVRFGPVTVDKTAVIELTPVSTSVTQLQIEYLQGDRVIGLGLIAVTVPANGTVSIVDPPFEDVTEALRSIVVTPAQITILEGSNQQFSALGTYADGTELDLTGSVTWSSSSPAVASVTAVGRATGTAAGNSTITASLGTVSGSALLTVSEGPPDPTNPTVTALQVTPVGSSIVVGSTLQFKAMATFSDSSSRDVTGTASWTSTERTIATVTTAGLATGMKDGITSIEASFGGLTAQAPLTVIAPVVGGGVASIVGITVTPQVATMGPGATKQFTALATRSDSTVVDVTAMATWASATPATATVADGGLVTGVAEGTTVISATVGSVTGEATVGVSSYVYVTEREDRSIRMFPRAGNGDIEPARVIIGNSSGLVDPRHPVLDPVKNELFVLNSGAGSVVVFDAMASGDAVPLRTISALDADLTVAYGLAIDPVRREIYVGFNLDRRVVLVFGMDDAGPVEPRRQFSVDADNMYGVTLDPVHNELFVTTLSDIRVFSRTAEGTASPLRTISGDDTRLTGASPNQVALDLVHDEIIVPCSGTSAESVLVFPRDAEGDVPPRTIDGPGVPLGVAVDPVANEIFVADIAAGSLKVFDRTAEGNAVPLRTISGGQTGLSRPSSVYLP